MLWNGGETTTKSTSQAGGSVQVTVEKSSRLEQTVGTMNPMMISMCVGVTVE
jgi:hypothetical protein